MKKIFPCILELHIKNKDGDYILTTSTRIVSAKLLNSQKENFKNIYALQHKDYRMFIVIPSAANKLIQTKTMKQLDKEIDEYIQNKEFLIDND